EGVVTISQAFGGYDVFLHTGSGVDEPCALRTQIPADLRGVHAAVLLAVTQQADGGERLAAAGPARAGRAPCPRAVLAVLPPGPRAGRPARDRLCTRQG